MPMFEFICPKCQHIFEEMCKNTATQPCPECEHTPCTQVMSAPNLKTGAAPFKIGPVRPTAPRVSGACAGSAGGGCTGCGHTTTIG